MHGRGRDGSLTPPPDRFKTKLLKTKLKYVCWENMGKNKMQKLLIIKGLINVILLNVALVFIKRCCKDSEKANPQTGRRSCNT